MKRFPAAVAFLVAAALPAAAARADIVLSQLVVELGPDQHSRADVDVFNNGSDKAFVEIEPRLVLNPGSRPESALRDPDPDKLGILVSPARMILEPGQHRLLRVASIAASDRERVYRVTVKPVVGELASENSGLKLLVGYDMLVLVRPERPAPHVSGARTGDSLTLTNDGNVSVELVDGKACDSSKACDPMPSARLYAGASITLPVSAGRRIDYKMKVGPRLEPLEL
jgi:P pilus assembly chaperone PapD